MTREECIEWLKSLKTEIGKSEHVALWHYAKAIDTAIETLSADRPTGRWIFEPKDAIELMFIKPKCSECDFESADGGNFCSNCGAKMKDGDSK